jgi:DNA-directed RNA polymerase specialized sigma24 family protein
MDLTQESFDRLLSWLHPDREEAGKAYVKIRSGLIKKFASHGCPLPDKLADETIDRVARKLPEIADTYIGERERYFYRVAYYVLLESYAKNLNETELTEDLNSTEKEDVETEFYCLEKCMDGLPSQKQYLIRNYYSGEKGTKIRRRKELALTFNVELPALRVQALRIRQDLKGCIQDCLRELGR